MFKRDLRVPDVIIYVILLDFVILEIKHYLKRNSSFLCLLLILSLRHRLKYANLLAAYLH